MKKYLLIVLGYCLLLPAARAQNAAFWMQVFRDSYEKGGGGQPALRSYYQGLSKSCNSYDFMMLSGGANTLIQAFRYNGDKRYLLDAVALFRNVIDCGIPDEQGVLHWYGMNNGYVQKRMAFDAGQGRKDVRLYEGYLFKFLPQLLFYAQQSPGALDAKTSALLRSVAEKEWTKWAGPQGMPLERRVHMSAHWATYALYLKKVSGDKTISSQCTAYLSAFNTALQANLRTIPCGSGEAYTWNSTWSAGAAVNNRLMEKRSFVQDVSHGGVVVDYMLNAYQEGETWTKADVQKLVGTFKCRVWNSQARKFNNTLAAAAPSESTTQGKFQADGWVRLAQYDKDIAAVYYDFYRNQRKDFSFLYQDAALSAQLANCLKQNP